MSRISSATFAREKLERLLRIMAENVIDDREAFQITNCREESTDAGIILHFTAVIREPCVGQMIGRGGELANSIRNVMKAAAKRHGLFKVYVNLDAEDFLPARRELADIK